MTSVTDVGYTLWLKAHHLKGRSVDVTIEKVTVEELHPRPGVAEKKLVLSFKGKNRRLILNGGNTSRLVDLGGEDYTAWAGLVIRLEPGTWGTRQTIIVKAATNGGDAE